VIDTDTAVLMGVVLVAVVGFWSWVIVGSLADLLAKLRRLL
jgi:hypothetical protein